MSPTQSRSRLQLLLIAGLFLTPFIAAVLMRFGGWEPPQTRNYGELLAPPLEMAAVEARDADGRTRTWVNQDRHWTLLLQLPQRCDAACSETAAKLPQVHLALGRHYDKLHPFQVGPDPMSAAPIFPLLRLGGVLPSPLAAQPDAMPRVWLVDPHGYLVVGYPEGFDPSGLRRDLARLIK